MRDVVHGVLVKTTLEHGRAVTKVSHERFNNGEFITVAIANVNDGMQSHMNWVDFFGKNENEFMPDEENVQQITDVDLCLVFRRKTNNEEFA